MPGDVGHARVLVVAGRTATDPSLSEAVRARAARGPALFHLLVPSVEAPSIHLHQPLVASERVMAEALAILDAAAGRQITGSVSRLHDPMDAIEELLRTRSFDEILLSVVHHSVTTRLHLDLPHRVAHLGLPVTAVSAGRPAEHSQLTSS